MERRTQDPDTDLELTIEKARTLLGSVRSTGDRFSNLINLAGHDKSRDGIVFENKGDRERTRVQQDLAGKHGTGSLVEGGAESDSHYPPREEPDVRPLGNLRISEDQLDEGENIADQVRHQKEEFWASLIKRGFMKPQDVMVDGGQAANEVVDMILRQKTQEGLDTAENKNVPRKFDGGADEARTHEESKTKARTSITNAKRNLTLSRKQQDDQETQVGASLLAPPSHYYSSCSFQSTSTQDSYSSKPSTASSASYERSRHSGGSAESDDQADQSSGHSHTSNRQSSDQSKSSESASFPSYDGLNGE